MSAESGGHELARTSALDALEDTVAELEEQLNECKPRDTSSNLVKVLEDELHKLQRELSDGHVRACARLASGLRRESSLPSQAECPWEGLRKKVSELSEENRQLKERLSSRRNREARKKPSKQPSVERNTAPQLPAWLMDAKVAGEKDGSGNNSRSHSRSSSSSNGSKARKSQGSPGKGSAKSGGKSSGSDSGSSGSGSGSGSGSSSSSKSVDYSAFKTRPTASRSLDPAALRAIEESGSSVMLKTAPTPFMNSRNTSRRPSTNSRRPSLNVLSLARPSGPGSRRGSIHGAFPQMSMVLPGAPTAPAPSEVGCVVPVPARPSNENPRGRRRSLTTSCLADMVASKPEISGMHILEAISGQGGTAQVYFETFQPLEIWEGEILPVRALMNGRTKDTLRGSLMSEFPVYPGGPPARAKVLRPNGGIRATWDLISLLFVAIDVITVPLTFFNLEEAVLMVAVAWLGRLFWAIDIGMSFFTGYIGSDGGVVLGRRHIARRYARSWLTFDLVLVIIDWLSVLTPLDGSESAAQVGKAARVMRMLRMTRLLRLVRVQKVINLLSERIRSEKLVLITDIAKIVIMVLGFAHILACIWYGLGQDRNTGWVHHSGFDFGADLGHWYALSFHWSLAQFSGLGFDEIRANNLEERIFSIGVTFVAFAVASAVVSSLTSTLTRLHILASAVEKQVSTLRRYLSENCITTDLSLRIQRNAQHRMREQQHLLDESGVKLLELVSEALRAEMHFELYSPLLSEHPFLKRYCELHPQVMTKVCHSAVSRKSVSRGDVVFNKGELPSDPQMLFVESGVLEYEMEDRPLEEVGKKRWIAEANLWTTWMHRGTLKAKSDCRLLVLDAMTFQDKVSQFYTSEVNPRQYAKLFVDGLNEMEHGLLSDLTVIHTAQHEESDLVIKEGSRRSSRRSSRNSMGSANASWAVGNSLLRSKTSNM